MSSEIQFIHLDEEWSLPSLDHVGPFRAVILSETPIDEIWRSEVAVWLVRSGCLYMMAWGVECSEWDTAVDIANIDACGGGDIPDDKFVMTTWHADDSLEEVLWFAKNLAFHENIELAETLVIQVGGVSREDEIVEEWAVLHAID